MSCTGDTTTKSPMLALINFIQFELARFTAKQLGQFARPATLAFALTAAIALIGLDVGKLTLSLHDNCTRFLHSYLPL